MRTKNHYFYLALAVALSVFFAKLAYVSFFPHVTTWEYEDIANNILAGNGFSYKWYGTWYNSFGGPLFSCFCAALYAIFGHHQMVILVAQGCFSVIITLGCYDIGRRLFSPRVGFLAALLAALSPGIFYYDTHNLHSLSFDTSLAILGVLIVLILKDDCSFSMLILAGVLHGLSLLERSTQVVLVFLVFIVLWQTQNRKKYIQSMAAYCIAMAVVMAPWVVRNFLIYQKPILVATTDGEVFWRGNNPVASGGAYANGNPGVSVFDAAPEEFQNRIINKDELTQRKIFFEEGWSYVRSHPLATAKLYVKKLFTFWWFSEQTGFLYPHIYLLLYKTYYSVVLFFAVIGISLSLRKNEPEKWMVIAFMISVSVLQAIFYVDLRHRWGIEPLLLIFTAVGVFSTLNLFDRFFKSKSVVNLSQNI